MRILVTGGAGFIGSSVVGALLAAGYEVRVLDALIPGVHPDGVVPALPTGVELIRRDIRDPDAVDAALRGIDVVSHQAAMVGRGREILDAPQYVGCNDLGTATLLAAMCRAGLGRLVLASSVAIYGDCRYDCPADGRVRPPRRSVADLAAGRWEPRCPLCDAELTASAAEEDDLLDPPRNVYALSKLAQEYLAEAWARETGGQVVALRYHNVYGPGMPYDSPYSGVASAFRSAIEAGQAPSVYEDGGPRRDFVHVRDVAAANVAAVRRADPGFRAFNVASGRPTSILELAEALTAIGGGQPPVITGKYRVGDVRHIFASPARLTRELAWRPEVNFQDGMKEFATASMRGLS